MLTYRKKLVRAKKARRIGKPLSARRRAELVTALDAVPVANEFGATLIALLKKGVAEGHQPMSAVEIRAYLGRPDYEADQA